MSLYMLQLLVLLVHLLLLSLYSLALDVYKRQGSLLAKLELEDVIRANTTQSLTGTYLLTFMNANRFQITVNRDCLLYTSHTCRHLFIKQTPIHIYDDYSGCPPTDGRRLVRINVDWRLFDQERCVSETGPLF